MTGIDSVLTQAAAHGWEATWLHKLLILRRDIGAVCYLAQVLFRDNGRWSYAITYHRYGGFWALSSESPSEIVRKRGDFFAYLRSPREDTDNVD